jgi:hypothetical protein
MVAQERSTARGPRAAAAISGRACVAVGHAAGLNGHSELRPRIERMIQRSKLEGFRRAFRVCWVMRIHRTSPQRDRRPAIASPRTLAQTRDGAFIGQPPTVPASINHFTSGDIERITHMSRFSVYWICTSLCLLIAGLGPAGCVDPPRDDGGEDDVAAAVTTAACSNYGGTGNITGPNTCATGTFVTHSTWFGGGGVGLLGQEIWTYANGNVPDSTATYSFHGLSSASRLQIQAYIPNNNSNALRAHYHFCSPGGGCADGSVNQKDFTNAWANVGIMCTSDGTATVVLSDDGGDQFPVVVGADAIRVIAATGKCSF